MNTETWKSQVREKLENIDWQTVRNDIQPFLERKVDLDLLTLDNLMGLLPLP